jgi:hypothetical protein
VWEKDLNPCQRSALGIGLTVDNRRVNIRKEVDKLVIKSYPQVVKAIAHKVDNRAAHQQSNSAGAKCMKKKE